MSSAYATAEAFRKAITGRAKQAALIDPSTSPDKRMRQFAYNRFLTRIFNNGNDEWVLKGGVALLARLPDARHSRDIDLARRGQSVDDVSPSSKALRKATSGTFSNFGFRRHRNHFPAATPALPLE